MVISIDVFGIKDICPSSFYGSSYETHCSATVVNALKEKRKRLHRGMGSAAKLPWRVLLSRPLYILYLYKRELYLHFISLFSHSYD